MNRSSSVSIHALAAQCNSADIGKWARRAFGLLLFKGGSKRIGATVAMHLEEPSFDDDCVRPRGNNNEKCTVFS